MGYELVSKISKPKFSSLTALPDETQAAYVILIFLVSMLKNKQKQIKLIKYISCNSLYPKYYPFSLSYKIKEAS